LGYNTRLYKIAVVAVSYGLGDWPRPLCAVRGFANTELLFWLLSGQADHGDRRRRRNR